MRRDPSIAASNRKEQGKGGSAGYVTPGTSLIVEWLLQHREQVEAELQRILSAPAFASAKRLSGFLAYVVHSALEGAEVKESLIGVAVYGREPTYDPKSDSIVRAEASRLRAKLREYYEGAGKDSPVRIELPKGGYQPAFQVMAAPAAPAAARPWRWFAVAILLPLVAVAVWWTVFHRAKRHSIAVAPLLVASSDRAMETLATSLTSELRDTFIASKQWRVSPLTLAPGVAGRAQPARLDLGATAEVVLTGSLRSGSEGTVQVDLQLVNAADGYILWTGTYRNRVAALIESQKDFARRVSEEVAHKFAGLAPPPRSEHYSQARELVNSNSVQGVAQSIRLFEQAIQSDPRFSPAWAGLAQANLQLADLAIENDTPQRVEAAREAARKAIALDNSNAEAHATLGRIYLDRDWDFRQAVAELSRAVALDPVSITPTLLYSRALSMVGDLTGAEEAVSIAKSRLPAIPDLLFQEGSVYFLGHKFERMEAIGRELIALMPNRTLGYWLAGIALEQRGRVSEAIAAFENGLRHVPKDDHRTLCALGHSYALAGDRTRAMDTMHRYLDVKAKTITRYTLAYCAALTYTALQERDAAFEWLEKARLARDNSFPFFPLDPRFDALRPDPRYAKLAASLQ